MSTLSIPRRTREILARHGLSAKKSLGQNFMLDSAILDRMVEAAGLSERSNVLEIGPGLGALTEKLAASAGKVVAVEIDRRLLPVLEETLAPYPNVSVIHGDILKLDLRDLWDRQFANAGDVHVVANLPYYITTPIIMSLLEARVPLSTIIVMVQREVADRIAAKPGTKAYGSLSIAVKYYCDADIVTSVPRTAFVPQPNVDSAVLRLRLLSRPRCPVRDESFFFEIVAASFAQRRKTIENNLGFHFGAKRSKQQIRDVLVACGIDPARRGETLTIEEYAALADALFEHVPSST